MHWYPTQAGPQARHLQHFICPQLLTVPFTHEEVEAQRGEATRPKSVVTDCERGPCIKAVRPSSRAEPQPTLPREQRRRPIRSHSLGDEVPTYFGLPTRHRCPQAGLSTAGGRLSNPTLMLPRRQLRPLLTCSLLQLCSQHETAQVRGVVSTVLQTGGQADRPASQTEFCFTPLSSHSGAGLVKGDLEGYSFVRCTSFGDAVQQCECT